MAIPTPHRASNAGVCWCGSGEAEALGQLDVPSLGSTVLLRCAGCGAMRLSPMPTDEQLLPLYAPEYYGGSRVKFSWPISSMIEWFQHRRARRVAARMPPGGAVLDVGCGNGGFLIHMRRLGMAAHGTEWTQVAAARIPRDAGITLHVGDLLGLDLPPHSFDAVTLWHVLEHTRDPRATLARVHRLLKPSGLLFLSLPNAESRQSRRFGTHWFHHDPGRHLHALGPRSMARLLELTGFTLESISTRTFEQNPYGWIQSRLNAWGFPRDRAYTMLKGLARHPWPVRLFDLLLVSLLTPPGIVVATLESMRGEGAAMALCARPLPSDGGAER